LVANLTAKPAATLTGNALWAKIGVARIERRLRNNGVNVKNATRKGRAHKAIGAEPRKQLGYRPDDEVLVMIKQAAEAAGRTMSAEIDATLRRAYDTARQDRAELEDVFGGAENFAFGYLMARVRTAIEAECLEYALPETEAEVQVKQAHDFVVTNASGVNFAVEAKHAGAAQKQRQPVYISFSVNSELPWRRVLAAIAQNLSSPGNELWWPLADHPKQRRRAVPSDPPLRPTIDQLRSVCLLRTPVRVNGSYARSTRLIGVADE
jgi:hypothetical protein